MTSLAVIKLRRADTYEPECQRTTHRLQTAMGILNGMGVKPTQTHDPDCHREWVNTSGRAIKCEGSGPYPSPLTCLKTEWPEWVTNELFDMAYNLADKVITDRGQSYRAEGWRLKIERERRHGNEHGC